MQGAPGVHRARGRRSTAVTLPAAAGAGGTIGRPSGSGAADGRRPAAPGVQEQVDVGGDVVAQEGDLQQDDRGEDQYREQPRADPPPRGPGLPVAARLRRGARGPRRPGRPPVRCRSMGPPPRRPPSPARRARRGRHRGRSRPPRRCSLRATAGTPATGSSSPPGRARPGAARRPDQQGERRAGRHPRRPRAPRRRGTGRTGRRRPPGESAVRGGAEHHPPVDTDDDLIDGGLVTAGAPAVRLRSARRLRQHTGADLQGLRGT